MSQTLFLSTWLYDSLSTCRTWLLVILVGKLTATDARDACVRYTSYFIPHRISSNLYSETGVPKCHG